MPVRVALATCAVLPEPDPDEAPLLEALMRSNADATTLPWDNGKGGCDHEVCVLRATWNYYEKPIAFLRWCAERDAHAVLLNPLAAVEWNLHKGYLAELERAGVPIVPTVMVPRSPDPPSIAELCRARGWTDVVVKPAISAASFMTLRITGEPTPDQSAWWRRSVAERDMMVQPFMASVETSGERSIIWIDGAISHAIRKSPRFAGSEESISADEPPSAEECDLAHRALCAMPVDARRDLLYARIDLMRCEDGAPMISELELIEPSLFFLQHEGSADRMADAILKRFV